MYLNFSTVYRLNHRPPSIHAEGNDRRRRTNIIIVSVTAVFFVGWLPINILRLVAEFSPSDGVLRTIIRKREELVYGLLSLLGASNACINPILYGYFNQNFRGEYKHIIRKLPWHRSCGDDAVAAAALNATAANSPTHHHHLLNRGNSARVVTSVATEQTANGAGSGRFLEVPLQALVRHASLPSSSSKPLSVSFTFQPTVSNGAAAVPNGFCSHSRAINRKSSAAACNGQPPRNRSSRSKDAVDRDDEQMKEGGENEVAKLGPEKDVVIDGGDVVMDSPSTDEVEAAVTNAAAANGESSDPGIGESRDRSKTVQTAPRAQLHMDVGLEAAKVADSENQRRKPVDGSRGGNGEGEEILDFVTAWNSRHLMPTAAANGSPLRRSAALNGFAAPSRVRNEDEGGGGGGRWQAMKKAAIYSPAAGAFAAEPSPTQPRGSNCPLTETLV